jgi:hypothetical protein
VANAFKSGASQSRSTGDFNERAKLLSERLGAIEKPLQMKRGNAPRRSFKSGPRPEGEPVAEQAQTETETETDNEAEGETDGEAKPEA